MMDYPFKMRPYLSSAIGLDLGLDDPCIVHLRLFNAVFPLNERQTIGGVMPQGLECEGLDWLDLNLIGGLPSTRGSFAC